MAQPSLWPLKYPILLESLQQYKKEESHHLHWQTLSKSQVLRLSLKFQYSELQQSESQMQIKGWLLIVVLMVTARAADPRLDKHIIPVYGNASLGYYYINLFIGSPPQEQSVIIDTGSGQLALPCSECVSCGPTHIQRPFDIRQSSTNKIITCNSGYELCKETCLQKSPKPCTFLISYAEGSSLSGILIEDAIQFEQDSEGESITTTFGCTIRETNLFYTQAANGIFGLAPKRKARLLELLYERHSNYTGQEFLFSMCLSTSGGQLAIGKVHEELTNGMSSVKTTFSAHRNLYSLENVGRIIMNRTILRDDEDLGYYGLFIDSGSTFTYFPSKWYKLLQREVQNSCAYNSDRCKIAKRIGSTCFRIDLLGDQSIKQAMLSIFPSIDIEINGEVVSWSPNRYFLLRNRKSGQVCLGVQALDRFLLGGNWMVDRNIVFNLKQQTVQIFSDVKCTESSQSVDLPLYSDPKSGPLNYISAVLQVNEDLVERLLLMILIAVIIVLILIFLGVYFFKKPKAEEAKEEHEVKQLSEEQDVTIVNMASQNSHRELQANEVEQQKKQVVNQ